MPRKRPGQCMLWPPGSDLASPPSPTASSPGGPPAARTLEKRSPTSHLFWQKQQEWQRSCASLLARGGEFPGPGAVFHPRGSAGAREWSYQQIARLQPGDGQSSAPGRVSEPEGQAVTAVLSRWLPGLRWGVPAPSGGRQPGTRDGREAGAVTMGMGEALMAAASSLLQGGNGSSQPDRGPHHTAELI